LNYQMVDKKPDRTRNERQARRREREKQWLGKNGWTTWEAVHTLLMTDKYQIVKTSKGQKLEVSAKRNERIQNN
jgi:hypothetical protein